MSIQHGYTNSFLDELTQAIHNLDTDTLKMALFSASAAINGSTTAYSTTDEISGTGYTAGGKIMTLASGYPALDTSLMTKSFRFDNTQWTNATFSAACALIYNSSKANRSVLVIDFGGTRSVASNTFAVAFPLTLPPPIVIRASR